MKNNKVILLGILVLLAIVLLNLVRGQEIKNSYTAEVEPDVLVALNSSEWVAAIIEINYGNLTLLDQILSNFTENEFQLQEVLLGNFEFAGNITQKGLDKLVNNPNVKGVYISRTAHVSDNKMNGTSEIIPEDKKEVEYTQINFYWLTAVLIILLLIIYFILRLKCSNGEWKLVKRS